MCFKKRQILYANISKSFFGVRVLFDVNFSVRRGEVHALLGENGAGESALTKILSAVYRKESGEIILDGQAPGTRIRPAWPWTPASASSFRNSI